MRRDSSGRRDSGMRGQRPYLRWPTGPGGALGGVVGALYAVFIGLPIVALLARAAQQDDLWGAITGDLALTALRLSVITSIISIGVVIVTGTPIALALARSNHWMARTVDALVELPIVLPPVVAGVAMLMAFGRGGIVGGPLRDAGLDISFTTTAVVFAQIFVAAPFYIRSAKLGFQAVARDYEEVSQTLGMSPLSTFRQITMPLAAPAIITGLGLSWARALSEFGATMMFAGNLLGETQTMPLAIMTAMETSLDSALALSAFLLVVSVLALTALTLASRRRWSGRV